VGIVVVNWNGADDTIACLDSLARLDYPRWRTYVVDNASSDDSALRIRAAHPESCLVQAERNLGYAGAFNLGCTRVLANGAEYIWLLNNDTTVEWDSLRALVEAAQELGAALYSPKILRADCPGELWYAGGYLEGNLKSHHRGRGEQDRGQYDRRSRVTWATGCALFLSAVVAHVLGPMDERYFLYLEDVDWCLSASARGIPTYFVPRARVYHGVSRSVDRLDPRLLRYYAWRNYYLLVFRHGTRRQRLRVYADLASRFVKIGLRQVYFPNFRHNSYYHARTRALVDFVRGRMGPAPASLCDGPLPPQRVLREIGV
jgi:hypothetical protein